MRAIIVGAGEVGYQVAKFLVMEGVEVVVLDRDREKLTKISEELDVATIHGEGGSPSALAEAGAGSTDILLAVTNSDETNMIACLIAKAMFGVPRKIARIRNHEYIQNEKLLNSDNLDINPAINPELEVANAVIRLVEIPFSTDVKDFEGGSVKVIGYTVPQDFPYLGKTLKSLRKKLPPTRFLIGIIERGDDVIIPTGKDRITAGDVIYMPVKRWEIGDLMQVLGVSQSPAKRVMIVGGGRIGHHIASVLEQKADVKLIDKDEERCKLMSKQLDSTIVLLGDGTDEGLLKEENVSDMDVFVTVSNNEELNLMASLLAKRLGARKTITLVNRTGYINLAHSLGLHSVLSPRLITASSILKYVRSGEIITLTSVAEGKAEILEAHIGKESKLKGKKLEKASLPESSLVGVIIRDEKIIIPSGQDVIQEDDKIIFFTLRKSVKAVEKLFV